MAAPLLPKKVSAVDTAWLRMDRPHNLMMIAGVLMFRERLDIATLRRIVEERFLVFRRFRQRPAELAGVAVWETDRDFDIERHVVHTALPQPAGRKELQALVSRLATTPLDPARPRWQFQVVDHYDGGSAIVDARTKERFTGELPSGYPGVAGGHMPGAINVPWGKMIPQSGDFTFVGPDRAEAILKEGGVDLSKPVIATCGSGVTAAILAFQLARMGKTDVTLYDGSWHEWGQRPDLPKESV